LSLPGSDGDQPVSAIGERGLIGRIRARVPAADPSLVVGIGDDAAVAAPDRGALQVITTDALVEGVHFDRRFSSWEDIGYKALAVNASDVAAMGGASRFALLSLMLPDDTRLRDVDALLDGLLQLAAALRVTLAGGNITRSPGPLVVDVTAIGSVKPRKILTRGGGRAGDAVYVTGSVGSAAAGLGWLRSQTGAGRGRVPRPDDAGMARCVERHCRPEPRARVGAMLGRTRAASACMDTSDGLADALAQMAAASGTGMAIDGQLVPVDPAARAWFESAGRDAVSASLAGGDDYELVFTVPKRRRGRLRGVIREARGVPVTRIGELTAGRGVSVSHEGGAIAVPAGFTHF
jgi:thiamine-monophosphate kinase